MKKWILFLTVWCIVVLIPAKRAAAQKQEIQQLVLNVEKLAQFKKILQQMYDYYKMVEAGYNKVRDVASGNFKIHEVFLDGLMVVSPEVRKYKRIADITQMQIALVKEYKSAFNMFKSSGIFSQGELKYLSDVYDRIINESLQNLDALLMIVTSGKLRMSDDERLRAIDGLYSEMTNKLEFLRNFNSNNQILALQRIKDRKEIEGMRGLHGVE